MKQKLLITMGCSWTEGYGCYDETTIPENVKKTKKVTFDELEAVQEANFDRFHELGWPVGLAKKLGFDKLINLGFGGSSTSGQLKRFYELYYNEKFEDYEVTVIWLLTQSTRFSFYAWNQVRDIMPAMPHYHNPWSDGNESEKLGESWLKFVNNYKNDAALEQLFHIKCMEQYCENHNFNLILQHTDIDADAMIRFWHPSKYFISPFPDNILMHVPDSEKSYICNHPNEIGYKRMIDRMYQDIRKYHNYLIPTTIPKNLEWEWKGGHQIGWICVEEHHLDPLIGGEYIKQRLKNKHII